METCWLQRELPQFFEQQQDKNVHPRVMTFGYNANLWINATVDGLQAPINALINSLNLLRGRDPMRPLLFVGHSLGGIVVKQVINDLVTSSKQQNPQNTTYIKGCLFLAVPHKGTGNADDLEKFLKSIKKFLLPGMGPNIKYVEDLKRKSLKMATVSERFVQVLNTNDIGIISCYELQPYNKAKGPIVSKESAILDYGQKHTLWPINANHSGIAAFGSVSQHPFVEIASELASYAHRALVDQSARSVRQNLVDRMSNLNMPQMAGQSAPYYDLFPSRTRRDYQKEPEFFKLTRYKTTFLVDDSSSMEDIPEEALAHLPKSEGLYARPWSDTIHAIKQCGNIILNAGGSLNIHFFNNERVKEDPSGPEDIAAFCHSIRPHGDTPTYDRLKEHLDDFLDQFKRLSIRERSKFPGLNLIIFTDGAPEGPFDDIREVIADTVKELGDLRATKNKIGIQWVQIGKDAKVAEFFSFLDDKLAGNYNLREDIVDTVRYDPATADEGTYKKIVLGAINKDEDGRDEQAQAGAGAVPQAAQPRYDPYSVPSQGPSGHPNLPPELVASQTDSFGAPRRQTWGRT